MSIYATNFIINENGDPILIKHLNKKRVDRYNWTNPGGWNKSGKKARINKESNIVNIKKRRYWKLKCKEMIWNIDL